MSSSPVSQAQRRADRRRRALDLVLGSVLFVLTLPLMLVIAASCAIALQASPIFVQDRIGRDGQTFRFLKIRTLRPDVPAYVDKHQLDLTRVPRLCRVVRRLHLDELPQLALVVVGRMSLVGPRPEMAHLHDALPVEFTSVRTSVRPGCTGFWQISDGCTGLIGEAPQYDRFYVAHRGVRFDLWVLFHTALKMVGRPQFPQIEDVPAGVLVPVVPELVELTTATATDTDVVPVAVGQ